MRLRVASLLMTAVAAQAAARLAIRTDLACRVSVDGQSRGALRPGETLRLELAAGAHQVEAVKEGATWRETVEVAADVARDVAISLQKTWRDPSGPLVWATSDNGVGVTWTQANRYCSALTAGGLSKWRLPTIEELHGLFGGPANTDGRHVRAPIQVTGWAWSASHGADQDEMWALDFGDGARASAAMGDSGLNRALCVGESTR